MAMKTLDRKLARLKADPHCDEFILADAKDADMAFGIAAPGQSPEHHAHEGRFRSLAEYRASIREVVRQGVVDIVLMSAHTNAILAQEEGLFDNSPVTPAARANDTSDIHVVRGGAYPQAPSAPFQTTTIDHIQCGRCACSEEERTRGTDLGLYSVTFNNLPENDLRTLEAYRTFRLEAEAKGFRHFLEVFDPNAPAEAPAGEAAGAFVNDMIARMLAGVPPTGRPVFLKMVYHGPKPTEELAAYDPSLIIGVLGGAAGTSHDAFKLLADARRHGARAALFGRKINQAEHQLAFIEMLRRVADDQLSAEEAVHAYHGVLQQLGITPRRPLAEDLLVTDAVFSYGGGRSRVRMGDKPDGGAAERPPRRGPAKPDLAGMSSGERLAYHRRRLRGAGSEG